jgi:periplasmic protein TonB
MATVVSGIRQVQHLSANEQLKASFAAVFWKSMILATLLHFGLLRFFPALSAPDVSFEARELAAMDLPPEVEVPPPPEQIARPAMPVISETQIQEEITIAPTTFEHNPVEHLPTPQPSEMVDEAVAPTFTPYTVAPELRNRTEIARALERVYPPTLRDAGIGGRAILWFYIDNRGTVVRAQVKQSSGYPALDDAALKIADLMVFSPALNRDRRVAVWVALPIDFRTH